MTTFYDEVQEMRARYPEGTRSAVLPALRLAQERHGWLSREALEETADALDLTPAYCYSVASFYDMFQLEPVGRHTIEVCTNVCCGARQRAGRCSRRSSGARHQARRDDAEDGEITLRAVECLGGCSTPTIVAVDHRYRQSVTPEDVPAIVEELRMAETTVQVAEGRRSSSRATRRAADEPRAYREVGGYAQLEKARARIRRP